MHTDITETILHAKSTKGLNFADLAKTAGCNPIFLAAVCYRQASPPKIKPASSSTRSVSTELCT